MIDQHSAAFTDNSDISDFTPAVQDRLKLIQDTVSRLIIDLIVKKIILNILTAGEGRICRCTLLWNFLQEDDRLYTDRVCKGESQMNKKGLATVIVGKFKSIQSVIFSTVAFLVLIAVVIVTAVSMRFTGLYFPTIPLPFPFGYVSGLL